MDTLDGAKLNKQYETLHCTQTTEQDYHIVEYKKTNFVETKIPNVVVDTIFGELYFDGSNYKNGVGVGCILTTLKGNHFLMER